MNILFIGDLVGSSGRKFLKAKLTALKAQYQTDLCIANAENAAAGLGLTQSLAHEIHEAGVDLLTMGNHTWSKRDLLRSADHIPYMIRPANMPRSWPGLSYSVLSHSKGKVLVINLLGRVFMDAADDPFATADQLISSIKRQQGITMTVVDFHAEATSEKTAMAWHLDGRVSLLAGTHTHVQTADERILPRGTAYITDTGMTGPINSIIGMDIDSSLRRFVDRLPAAYACAKGPAVLSAVSVSVDEKTGRAEKIDRIMLTEA